MTLDLNELELQLNESEPNHGDNCDYDDGCGDAGFCVQPSIDYETFRELIAAAKEKTVLEGKLAAWTKGYNSLSETLDNCIAERNRLVEECNKLQKTLDNLIRINTDATFDLAHYKKECDELKLQLELNKPLYSRRKLQEERNEAVALLEKHGLSMEAHFDSLTGHQKLIYQQTVEFLDSMKDGDAKPLFTKMERASKGGYVGGDE